MHLKFRVAKRKLLTGKDSDMQGAVDKQVRQNGLYEAILTKKLKYVRREV